MATPIILCDCAGMSEKRWLECREHGPKGDIEYTVGGSDVATIFGLSPWMTPKELWMIKKGRMKPKDKPNPLQLEMGHLLEPIAAHFYAQRTGDTVTDDTNMYQHADFPYALADIDRRITRKADGEPGVLERKSCTYHKASDWADGAYPLYYEFQLRYYLAVMDVDFGAFSALWGNNPDYDLATPSLIRDRAKEDMIFERLALYQSHVYRPVMAKAEDGVAQCVREMLQRSSLPYIGDLDDEIDQQQEELGFTLAEEQRQAVKTALASPICIISGGPGTGKTSIQRVFLNIYQKAFPDADIICCAPTGRAARRLEQSSGLPACTVHKALNLTAGDTNTLTMPEQVDADLVLVDEISMLDMAMTWYLFHALPPMCRLVLVGDADQLPSVGPGAVLSELLRCGRIPMVMLDKVFRQSEGSMIAENARHIRHGDTDLQFDGDFQFLGSADIQQSAEWLERLYMQEVRRYGVDNVALLTPFRAKTETGVRSMNERLRTLVNPPGANKPELSLGQRIFRFGDKVMQTKNREEVSNGDIGYIRKIERDDDGFLVEVDFHDDRIVAYEDNESLSHLDLAYATTIHKSQGGQYDSVLLSIQNCHGRMLKRPLVYTGLTRARCKAQIVGDWQAVIRAIQTTDTERRNTLLAARIIQTAT